MADENTGEPQPTAPEGIIEAEVVEASSERTTVPVAAETAQAPSCEPAAASQQAAASQPAGQQAGVPAVTYQQPTAQQAAPQQGCQHPGAQQGYQQASYQQPAAQQGYQQGGYQQGGQTGYQQPTGQGYVPGGYGQPVQSTYYAQGQAAYPMTDTDRTLRLVAFIFMIISMVSVCWAIIPLAWMIPMTVMAWGVYKGTRPNTVAFGVCCLIFVSLVAGVLLLVSNKER